MKSLVTILLQIIGSLGLLLQGMKMMSDGIQKSAGNSLHKTLGLMTSNRIFAVLTGMLVTMIIQSSGATTVMVVSFVNAGLMTVTQAVGVIFGANIGTTITAWIVTLFGFSFKISAIAVPIFGVGFFLTFIKKFHKENIGEALMGFGLLFLGLDLLSEAIPSFNAENVGFLTIFNGTGFFSLILGILIAAFLTMLLHSSSAFTAIVITMAYNGLLTWEFSAALVLGSNIGSTIDAVIASIGTKVNARRAALVHVLFNVSGTILAIILFKPLLSIIDSLVPGPVNESIATHIAMLHTVFNISATLIFLPFTKQIASIAERIISPKENELPDQYHLEFIASGVRENSEAYILRAEKEIADMAHIAARMFERLSVGFEHRDEAFIEENFERISKKEEYADQMNEQLTNYLVACSERLTLNEQSKHSINNMLLIVDELEALTDDCYKTAILLKRSVDKKMEFSKEDMQRLVPYSNLAQNFLTFINENINKKFTEELMAEAMRYEAQIDATRHDLKKVAKKRLEEGANVKAELLYIDIVRTIEKIGDHSFSIAKALSQQK